MVSYDQSWKVTFCDHHCRGPKIYHHKLIIIHQIRDILKFFYWLIDWFFARLLKFVCYVFVSTWSRMSVGQDTREHRAVKKWSKLVTSKVSPKNSFIILFHKPTTPKAQKWLWATPTSGWIQILSIIGFANHINFKFAVKMISTQHDSQPEDRT